ncbi:MAG: GDP-mannose 4,6-dehydratase [Candidatus Aenigmarchaeota archaeon]|nr:GDP-mannose 4,6-dehydratase [Candidatus Aenigmarchaeota archaeon]
MKSILVTGGAGFIGSTLSDKLLGEGHKVVSLDNFDPYYPRPIKEKNMESAKENRNFTFIEGDIRDQNLLKKIIREHGVEHVFHMAARPGVRPSIENPGLYNDINEKGTISLIFACLDSSVKKIVYSSSSSVYGNAEYLPTDEKHPTNPISPYGVSKLAAEKYLHSYGILYGIKTISLRLFTVYGPRQRPDEAICKFANLALQNKPVEVYGDGRSSRDFTYIGDIVAGHMAAMNSDISKEVFNLGSGRKITVNEIIGMLEKSLGKKIKINYSEKQKGDVSSTLADIRKAGEMLDWKPKVEVGDGIKRFAEWVMAGQL